MSVLATGTGARILLVSVAAAIVVSGLIPRAAITFGIAIVATAVGGYEIARDAVGSLLKRKMTMELSMTIAIVAALAIGEASTALLILVFVLIAEVLEEMNLDRGRRALAELVEMLPRRVYVVHADGAIEISIDDLHTGDSILVKPGSRIPADGTVVGGHSTVDQSTITGESLPVDKSSGEEVFAGTLNQGGSLEVRVTALGRDTTFGKIVKVIEESEAAQAPVQKLADRLAAVIVAGALGSSVLTYVFTRDVRASIAVVIVAGACGVAAGTPLAILAGIGQSARRNVIVKGGVFLERLALVDTVVFDKTGTLTLGSPRVSSIVPAEGVSAADVLRWAATAEQHSEHPLAAAIARAAAESSAPLESVASFEMIPGRGVVCRTASGSAIVAGNRAMLEELSIPHSGAETSHGTSVFVAIDREYAGRLDLSDLPRERSAHAVALLHGLGIRTVLLTGDHPAAARIVGQSIGIDEIDAELLPQEKQQRIRDLRAGGRIVAMVGDGINDAPALVEADVGVSMGSGTDITRESADVVLLGDDPSRIAEAIVIARRCRRVIMQNFAGTIAVDAVGIIFAVIGLLHPVSAAIVHVTSELLFILNSARLLPALHE